MPPPKPSSTLSVTSCRIKRNLLAPTASRSILGTMNEFGHMANRMRDLGRASDLLALSLELGEVPCRVTGHGLFPDFEMKAIVHGEARA